MKKKNIRVLLQCKQLEARDSLEIDIFGIDVGRAWLRMFDALPYAALPRPATPVSKCR